MKVKSNSGRPNCAAAVLLALCMGPCTADACSILRSSKPIEQRADEFVKRAVNLCVVRLSPQWLARTWRRADAPPFDGTDWTVHAVTTRSLKGSCPTGTVHYFSLGGSCSDVIPMPPLDTDLVAMFDALSGHDGMRMTNWAGAKLSAAILAHRQFQ